MKFTSPGLLSKKLEKGEIWIDTHSRPVSEEVWQLYRRWVKQHGPRQTLIEWDLDIPAPEVLLAEADKAKRVLSEYQTFSALESARKAS